MQRSKQTRFKTSFKRVFMKEIRIFEWIKGNTMIKNGATTQSFSMNTLYNTLSEFQNEREVEWVDVADELPEEFDNVYFMVKGSVVLGYFDGDAYREVRGKFLRGVSHWSLVELPKPIL